MKTATRAQTKPKFPFHPSFPQPRCDFLMHITVDTGSVTALRRLVAATCGAALSYMRIEAVDHAERMKVWLCVPQSDVERVMDAVMVALPAAEFGRIRPVQAA